MSLSPSQIRRCIVVISIVLLGTTIFSRTLFHRQQRATDALLSQKFTSAARLIADLPASQQRLYRGYLAYLQQDFVQAQHERQLLHDDRLPKKLAYNLGTLEAVQALQQSVPDTTGLQLAAVHLQQELKVYPDDMYAQHNLDVLRQLLGEQSPEQQQNQQEQSGSGEQEQENAGEEENSENQEDTQQGAQPSSALSAQQRQQLEQYQEYIEQQQLANQGYFGKEQQPTDTGDPFDPFDMFFGNQENDLQQEMQQTEKDR